MNNSAPNLVLLYGGTFNPLHLGHVKPVAVLSHKVKPQEVVYIPCHIPPHKAAPKVSSADRLKMTELGVNEYNEDFYCPVHVSDYEITLTEPSYTANTLSHFRKKLSPGQSLGFIIGMDSLLTFTSWYKWREILEKTFLYVLARPGYTLDESSLDKEISQRLGQTIHLIDSVEYDISSTAVRQGDTEKRSRLMPSSVFDYITSHQLYID